MSSRPIREKQIHRLEKALRNSLPTQIDLIQYLKDRRYAQTSGAARKLLLDGKVMVDSHIVGRVEIPDMHKRLKGEKDAMKWAHAPLISSKHRKRIVVLAGD